jgi:2-polyprenyl-3-methyl-5-hydroxy-6-metoxy-1,4-benzoquinol methylase
MQNRWTTTDSHVFFGSEKNTYFVDSHDHFQNGVLRLLDISENMFKVFVEKVCNRLEQDSSLDPIQAMQMSWKSDDNSDLLNPLVPIHPIWFDAAVNDAQWVTSKVRDDAKHGLAYSKALRHGWLCNTSTGKSAGLEDVHYEEEYFEGGLSAVGYGSYLEQSAWRLEKAHRQCTEIRALRELSGLANDKIRLLDIGSGYGFFRHACQQNGWGNTGIEISNYAAEVSRQLFSLDSYVGTLEQFKENTDEKFDVIVMWDFIEHVENPVDALKIASDLLSPSGSVFIRTPNLEAVEFRIFEDDYHSLKREHLNIFSPFSLATITSLAGMTPQLALTSSHLLKGFTMLDTALLATCQMGSDILLHATKPS